MSGEELYASTDYRAYLREYFQRRKGNQKSFSLRFWAKECGFAAPDYLLRVMRGDRNLSDKGCESLSKSMHLSPKMGEYFLALVRFNQASEMPEKDKRWRELLALRPTSAAQRLRQDQFAALENWACVALRSLLPVIRFTGDWEKLGRYLDPPMSGKQARESCETLERLGMLARKGQRYEAQSVQVTTGDEVASVALTAFHKETLKLAARSLDEQPPSLRDVSGITASLSSAGVAKFKVKLREFRKQLLALAAEDSGEDRVYHLGLHFFPLTKTGGWDD